METQQRLREQWGNERFAIALGQLSGYCISLGHRLPETTEEMHALANMSPDAFKLFGIHISELGNTILANKDASD